VKIFDLVLKDLDELDDPAIADIQRAVKF